MKVVTCIGDSETWCYGLSRGLDWPYKLAQALDGGSPTMNTLSPWSGVSDGTSATTGTQREYVGTNWTVRNAGISGDTSRGMRSRWATDVLGPSAKPDYVIIMCGENDLYYYGSGDSTYGLNYSPGGLKENIQWMVSSAQSNGITPILATPTPHGTLESTGSRWTGMQGLLKWLGTSMTWMSTSETANTLGLTLSDHYQAIYDSAHPAYARYYPTGSTYELDNIHPNAAGAQIIANTAAAAITATLIQAAGTVVAVSSVSGSATLGGTDFSYDLAADFSATNVNYDLASDFLAGTGTTYPVTGTVLTSATATGTIAAGRPVTGTVLSVCAATLTLSPVGAATITHTTYTVAGTGAQTVTETGNQVTVAQISDTSPIPA